MSMSFEPRSDADLVRLIAEYPLAWVVSCRERGFRATPLPLVAETDTAGRVVALFGHFALANPHVELLRGSAAAIILFSGPHGYISPEAVSQPRWAPTWNYAVAEFDVEIEFVPQQNDLALTRLVRKMEAGRGEPWTIAQLGTRYAQMVPRIIAFRAHVRTTSARFKLGQDETPRTRAEVMTALGESDLARWMRDFNHEEGA
jgi:transcriptional regulator